MKKILIILLWLFVSPNVYAENSREKDSHEHGSAVVNIVMEKEKLLIEFEVPSDSLIGFEYYPKSESNRDGFYAAMKILSDPSKFFMIPDDSECLLVGMRVSQSLFSDDEEHGHDDEEHGHDDEEHGHDDEEHGHDDEEHGHDDSKKSEIHSEFKSVYQWSCHHMDDLKLMKTKLIEIFPRIEEIRVNWVNDSGQGSLELKESDVIIEGWK